MNKTTVKDFVNKTVDEDNEEFQIHGIKLLTATRDKLEPHDKNTCLNRNPTHVRNCKASETDIKTPAKRRLNAELLNKYVSENGEVFRSDGKELFCKICKKNISFDTKHSVYRHLQSKKHNEILIQLGIEVKSKTQKEMLLMEELLKKYVSENTEAFETDGKILFCKLCKKSISFDKRSSVERHLKTKKHLCCYAQNINKSSENVYDQLSEAKEDLFIWGKNEDFCRTCMKQFSKAAKQKDKQNITETPAGYQNNTSIMEILEIIQPQIKVELKANLPTLMCADCIQKLMDSYEFIEMYKNVDKTLRKMLEEFNVDNCSNNLEEQRDILEEIEEPDDFEADKYEIKIEQVNIDGLEANEAKSDNEEPKFKDESTQDMSVYVENNETVESDPFNSSIDDDWIPENSCSNNSFKTHNSNVATKKVFKGFVQPETNDDGSLTCQLCKSNFGGVVLWRNHMRQFHLEIKHRTASNRRTDKPEKKEPQKLQRTTIQPNEEGRYKCEFCERTYSKYTFYRRHVRVHTREPHLCIECGKSFKLPSSYNIHMLRHKGDKKYKCPHCPKSFVCASGLYVHEMVHNNNKPFVCDTCGAAFHTAYRLKQHNLHHTGIKKFQCEYCDMRFISRETQQRHMRTHTGEKPYRCKYCERAFAQSNDCVKHLRQHLGDNVYQCDLCPLRFPLVRDLRVHFATHKDDDETTRSRNLQARMEEERELQIRLSTKELV